MPDAGPALGAGPLLVQRRDTIQCGLHFTGSGPAAAAVGRDVQRRPDVRLEVLEKRLDRFQHGFGPLFQRTSNAFEQLADFPPVIRLAAPEGKRRPQCLADLLQQLLERATGFRGRPLNVPAIEPLPRVLENPRRLIQRCPRARRVAP